MPSQEQEARIKSTILIVDDDIAARDTLEELLAYENYEIIPAANGVEALEWQEYFARTSSYRT